MKLEVVDIDILKGNDTAPPLKVGDIKDLIATFLDSKGNPHYDVGIKSTLNWVTSYETKEKLPNSQVGGVWWCHPSRFKEVI